MKRNALIVAALGLVAGAAILLRGTSYATPTESWLEQQTPDQVLGMGFVRSDDNPEQTYKMDETVYEQLKPFGIVTRIFVGEGKRMEAVVIAGDNADSFHDQRACFTSQGWVVEEEEPIKLNVAGETGTAYFISISKDGMTHPAIFCFRGPSGEITHNFDAMWGDFFRRELTTGKPQRGEFYRFIDLSPGADRSDIIEFSEAFLAQAVESMDADLAAEE